MSIERVEAVALFISTPFDGDDLVREFGFARMGANMLMLTMLAHGYIQVAYEDPPARRFKLARGKDALEVAKVLVSADAEHRISDR